MPNYVFTTISINNALSVEQKEILEKIKEVGVAQHYMPMPEDLRIPSSSAVDQARKLLGGVNGTMPDEYPEYITDEVISHARQSFVNEVLYGAKDWYGWRVENYGTKWGDFNIGVDEDGTITFETAWSGLNMELYELMAKDFPNMVIVEKGEDEHEETYCFIDGHGSKVSTF